MTDRIRIAFDSIHAEDMLKEKTLEFLRSEIRREKSRQTRVSAGNLAVGFALLLCLAFTGLLSMNMYFTETAYIDFDVNPSVELAVNRFDRVIGAYAYNSGGESVLDGLNIKHKTYKNAVDSMLDAFSRKGYLRDEALVSVTLQTNDSVRESEMLTGLAEYVETSVSEHHGSVQIDVFPVSGHVRDDAHALDLSPAKYLAILELQEVDPEATIESCRNHTIGELKSLARSHGAGHHKGGGDSAVTESEDSGIEGAYPHKAAQHHAEKGGHGGRHG